MIPSQDLEPILTIWRAQVHYAIEAGDAPDLAIGSSDEVLTTLAGEAALLAMAESRTDMTQPTVSTGGGTGAWLTAFARASAARAPSDTSPRQIAPPAPPWITLYTGADAATHIASGQTLPHHPNGLRSLESRGVPAGFADALSPTLHPAAPLTWENLPFRALANGGVFPGLRAAGAWCGWLALILCVLLIAGAILF